MLELSFIYKQEKCPKSMETQRCDMFMFINKTEIVYFGSRTDSQVYFTCFAFLKYFFVYGEVNTFSEVIIGTGDFVLSAKCGA